MKKIALILGIMIVALIALLESSGHQRRRLNTIPDSELEYDDVWWDN